MADGMDKLLFEIGSEQDSFVDYDGVLKAILNSADGMGAPPAGRAKPARPLRFNRYLGMAAALVALIGIGAFSLTGGGHDKATEAEAPAAEAPAAQAPVNHAITEAAPAMEYSMEDSPAEAAAAPQAPAEQRMAQAAAETEEAADSGAAADAARQEESEPAAQAPADPPLPAPTVAPVQSTSGESGAAQSGSGAPAMEQSVELGTASPGFEERLAAAGLRAEAVELELRPGLALITDGEAVYSTGSAVYHIAAPGMSAGELEQALRSLL